MAIQVTTNLEKDYPKIKIYKETNCIILFTEPDTGIVLSKGKSGNRFLDKSDYWAEIDFEDYNQPVTLTNM